MRDEGGDSRIRVIKYSLARAKFISFLNASSSFSDKSQEQLFPLKLQGRGRLFNGSIMAAWKCSLCMKDNAGGGKACGFCSGPHKLLAYVGGQAGTNKSNIILLDDDDEEGVRAGGGATGVASVGCGAAWECSLCLIVSDGGRKPFSPSILSLELFFFLRGGGELPSISYCHRGVVITISRMLKELWLVCLVTTWLCKCV
jgi:hypothetical protein